MVARGYFERVNHSIVGQHRVPTIPFRFRSVDRWCRSPAPTVGEHNESILKEWLGLDGAAIEALTAESVIGTRLKGID
jgi:crotonobetainyl-CoA:carnitine CoA-transferase CaiB-like acyl-CoA transferase